MVIDYFESQVENKARLVAQGHRKEEGIDYDERIFRYLKGQPKLGLWYHRDSPFNLEAYSDSDYARANLDRKSTTEESFSSINLYMADLKFVDQHNMVACLEGTENIATSKTVNSVKQIHTIVDGKAMVISESSVRSDLLFNDEDGIAFLTNAEIFENLALMGYEQISTKLTLQKGSFSPQ
nr:uncharacterized mitochondrial protein AtMg00810-like [Tanacetum cinerariifolium]